MNETCHIYHHTGVPSFGTDLPKPQQRGVQSRRGTLWKVAVFLIAACGMFALPAPSFAHGPAVGVHGGQMADAGGFHMEFMVTGGELMVYIADSGGQPVSVSGAVAEVTVIADRSIRKIPLAATGPNVLTGPWPAGEITGATRAVVTLRLPGQGPVVARFESVR